MNWLGGGNPTVGIGVAVRVAVGVEMVIGVRVGVLVGIAVDAGVSCIDRIWFCTNTKLKTSNTLVRTMKSVTKENRG